MNYKIPICNNVEEVKKYLKNNKNKKFCLYLAYKEKEDWKKSTSRVYMNQINEKFIYLPVNIEKEDYKSLKEIYSLCEKSDQIVAINHTQPHKSNVLLKELFKDHINIKNIDVLIKDKNGKLQLYDLNGPSFVNWFKEECLTFENKQVVIFGVGGVGETIVRQVVLDKPKVVYLVDKNSKKNLCGELQQYALVKYFSSLDQIFLNEKEIIFINCAGKEGADDASALETLKQYNGKNNIFVDLRPQLNIDIVDSAIALGWKGYTGFGMNSRNDYTLLLKICELINIEFPSFNTFKNLVASSS